MAVSSRPIIWDNCESKTENVFGLHALRLELDLSLKFVLPFNSLLDVSQINLNLISVILAFYPGL